MKSYSLPVSLIRQYLFCPRIPYYIEVMQLKPERPVWTQQGQEYHKHQKRLFKDRTLKRFNLENAQLKFNQQLQHSKYPFHGIADALLENDKFICPVEFKLYGEKPTKAQIYQTICYGLLAEANTNKIFNRCFILFEKKGKTHSFEVDQTLKNKVIKTVIETIDMLDTGLLPDSPASRHQCSQCEFLTFCNDRQ